MEVTDRQEPGNEIPIKKVYPRSVSQLKLYRQCSLSWKFQKFDKIKNQPAAWLPQGTAFGYVAEVWEKSNRLMQIPQQREIYFDKFDEEINKYKEIQPDLNQWLTMGRTKIQNDIDNRRERGWEQWERYRDRALTEEWRPWELPDGTPGAEVKFALETPFGLLRGAVDLVKEWPTGEITVNDLKTGNREKSSIQLAIYRLVLNEIFGLDITRGSFYYAKDDTYSDMLDLTSLDNEYLKGEFESMERGIDNRVFNANVGDHCALCPAKNNCKEYNSI